MTANFKSCQKIFDRNIYRGFAALLSIIVISVVLLFGVASLGQRAIIGRFILLDLERKAESEGYARACIEVARISISNDSAYSVSLKEVPVGSGFCTIVSVLPNDPSVGFSRVKARGESAGAITNIEAVVVHSTDVFSSYKEVVNF